MWHTRMTDSCATSSKARDTPLPEDLPSLQWCHSSRPWSCLYPVVWDERGSRLGKIQNFVLDSYPPLCQAGGLVTLVLEETESPAIIQVKYLLQTKTKQEAFCWENTLLWFMSGKITKGKAKNGQLCPNARLNGHAHLKPATSAHGINIHKIRWQLTNNIFFL